MSNVNVWAETLKITWQNVGSVKVK